MTENQDFTILFVCSGNACRSPLAAGHLKKALADQAIAGVDVISAGIEVLPSFKVPQAVIDLAASKGVDLSGHKPAQVDKKMVKSAGLILVMDVNHLQYMHMMYPKAKDKTFLLKSYLDTGGSPEITDPIGKPAEAYERTAAEIETYIAQLITKIPSLTATKE